VNRVPVTVARSRFIGHGIAGWVPLPRTVIFNPTVHVSVRLLAHELCHVMQAEHFKPWPLRYVMQWAATRFDYYKMPFEREARAAEQDSDYRIWAHDLIAAGAVPPVAVSPVKEPG
jgi:hypothetical protein